ncbi:odorant receptor 82a [Drosophila bipectinata]|uniref:odorant receptor 82a n=1 Tax=Drosophila bipectinata TaxID=42026 RepID=UPI001C898EC4|nr:odorant receptor 82a [Drosophila bipectinata]
MGRLFQLQENCLRAMGHTGGHENSISDGKLSVKHIVSLAFVVSAQYPLISYIVYNREDMEKVTACLSVVLTNMLTVIKITTFLAYKQDFWRMIQRFREMHQQYGDGYGYVAAANKVASLLGRAYCISCGITGLYFMLGPIVAIIASKWRGTTYIRELPMPMKFPFNDVNTPGYEVGFLYTVFVTVVVVTYASAVDGLFISFAINLRAHFQTLQRDIENFNYALSEREVRAALRSVVDYHVELLSMSKHLRVIYTPIVFGQFFITSLQVGVIIYQLVTRLDSIMDLLVYLSFLGSIMLQLFMYCYGGEIIKVESLKVDIAVRLSDWHLATTTIRKSLAFIILRSQREVLIKAGFYEASLANFVAICRTAMSLITLIKSIE